MTENVPAVQPAAEVAPVEKRVAQYIQIRDAIAKIKEKHEAELKPLNDLQNALTGWLQDFMDQSGTESVRTKAGTCYASARYTASLPDPEIFMKFVRETNNFDLLDRKANSTAVRDYVKEHGTLPPGVNLSAIKTVGVRRSANQRD